MRRSLLVACAVGAVLAGAPALPQEAPADDAPAVEATEAGLADAAAPDDLLDADALDTLVAPVALYPDALLAQVLVAATYPLDVMKADRFLDDNAALDDKARAEKADGEGWDESVDPEPYHGYYFRILTKQGPAAPGGAFDYMVGDRLLAGHALLAVPAAYGDSGVMSFLIAEAGQVYEADLGPVTLERAAAIDSFDPGEGWTPVTGDGTE